MDPWKFFDITHRDHVLCNPLSIAKADEMIDLLRLPDGGAAIDIACGKAEFTLRVAERYAVSVTGVDVSPYCIRDAEAKARERRLRGSARFALGDGAAYPVEAEGLDLAMCIGASWVFSGHAGTLTALAAMVRPGGLVLVGEPYWHAEPPDAYLRMTGEVRDTYGTHAANVSAGEALGLAPLYAMTSSDDDWDRYECLQWQAAWRYARERPDDPDVPRVLERIRTQREAYLQVGRRVMGWALYLFGRP